MTDDYAQPPEDHWNGKDAEDDAAGRSVLKLRRLSDIKAPPPPSGSLADGFPIQKSLCLLVKRV